MELKRRSVLIYALLAALWVLVVVWQVEEHVRVQEYARNGLRNRSKDIANTLGSYIRGLQVQRAVFSDRLQPVLDDLVNGRTNELVKSGEVLAVAVLNTAGDQIASAGIPIDTEQKEIQQEGERWGQRRATFLYPIEGARLAQEGMTNPPAPVLVPPFTNSVRDGSRPFGRREPRPGDGGSSNVVEGVTNELASASGTNSTVAQGRPAPSEGRPRLPRWARARGWTEAQYLEAIQTHELHGMLLTMSIDAFQAVCLHDLWLRCVIAFFATVSVVSSGLAWGNLVKSSGLQIRLVRASELNTHLKEMNLAAAGLAHETRNPLNIIRGLAQMISKRPETAPEIQQKSRDIIDEADKVAAQLNEFINYSRPREVRRTRLALGSVVNEVIRALNYDLEEKKIALQVEGEQLNVEADEQLLRQALFNLILNAIQAADGNGEIRVRAEKRTATEALLEVRDNGPGVPAERRTEIFKPYFTTQKRGTGLGLAVVQQIVLAHGWEIECLPNEPKGAVFRITHLKVT
ncbi:MAG TPA: HAMP domain-containing sensor histidine kinase [Candidatus Binatia bacterium]|jgi:signal transduction histidine kinase|nr:HAMP domain-containing sensor histidine kinase [Candidatus Binatia bacterium]